MTLPFRLLIIALLTLVVAGGAVLWYERTPALTQEQSANRTLVGGPFILIDSHGKTQTEALLRGHLSLVYFGFTYCPDICPTELAAIGAAIERFEAAHPDKVGLVQPVFISVDPERDTPAVIGPYVAAFHPRMIGLTGTPAQIEAAKKAYRVYAAKRQDPEMTDYTVDHSSLIFLMDRDGRYVAHFGAGADPADILGRLESLAS